MKKLFLILITCVPIGILLGQQTILDASFGSGGKVVLDIGSTHSFARDLLIIPNGKIIVGGSILISGNYDYIVSQLDSTGVIDTSFGDSGKTITNFSADKDDFGQKLVFHTDSTFLLVGVSQSNIVSFLGLGMYRFDGSLRVPFEFSSGPVIDTSLQATVQPDGKINYGGWSLDNSFCVVRVLPNAFNEDLSFGEDGKADLVLPTISKGFDLLLQADGKHVLIGSSGFSSNEDFAVGRMNSNGSRDTSFNGSGYIILDLGSNKEKAISGTFTSTGKILVAGIGNVDGEEGLNLFRINTNGILDTTFGISGVVKTKILPHLGGKSVIVLSNGKILVVGSKVNNGDEDFALARFSPEGIPDSTFGQNGILLTDFGGTDDRAFSVAYDSLTQSIVVVGESVTDTSSVFAIAKYSLDAQVGIEEFPSLIREVKIYPNPGTSESKLYFSLKRPEYLSINMIDIQGRLVKQVASNRFFQAGGHTLDLLLKDLTPGTYNLQLRNRNSILQTERIVIKP